MCARSKQNVGDPCTLSTAWFPSMGMVFGRKGSELRTRGRDMWLPWEPTGWLRVTDSKGRGKEGGGSNQLQLGGEDELAILLTRTAPKLQGSLTAHSW